jgi:hypothetical protein
MKEEWRKEACLLGRKAGHGTALEQELVPWILL